MMSFLFIPTEHMEGFYPSDRQASVFLYSVCEVLLEPEHGFSESEAFGDNTRSMALSELLIINIQLEDTV